jgi:RNA polymerase sigma-70 factor (ECF subfamily)
MALSQTVLAPTVAPDVPTPGVDRDARVKAEVLRPPSLGSKGHSRATRVGTMRAMEVRGREAAKAESGAHDRLLAARLAAGDPDALKAVYREHGALVLGIARRVLRDQSLAEDVTQEVFAFLWQNPDRYDPTRGSLRSWVGLLAHRRSVDRVRSESRRSRTESRVEGPLSEDADVDDRLTKDWLCQRVRQALDLLPPEQKEVLVQAYYGGRTYREVAADLRIPEGTAKSRIRLALNRLNDMLRADIATEEPLAWT